MSHLITDRLVLTFENVMAESVEREKGKAQANIQHYWDKSQAAFIRGVFEQLDLLSDELITDIRSRVGQILDPDLTNVIALEYQEKADAFMQKPTMQQVQKAYKNNHLDFVYQAGQREAADYIVRWIRSVLGAIANDTGTDE